MLARMLMRSGAMRGYACVSCPRENFWQCEVGGEPMVVCHPDEVIDPDPTITRHEGPYR